MAVKTDVQEVVLTGDADGRPLDLFLDGRLRAGGSGERRYHEALVHPAMSGPHARVLILGGGDGLAAREVLRHPDVRRVDVVELDPGLARLARHDPGLSELNEHAYGDPRVHAITADAFHRLRSTPTATYDVVISDLPDPGLTASTKLYSQEFYGLLRRVLAPDGRLVVHAGPLSARPRAFWTVDATLHAAGLRTAPTVSPPGHRPRTGPRPHGRHPERPPRLGLPPGRPHAPRPAARTDGPPPEHPSRPGPWPRTPAPRPAPGSTTCRRRRWYIRRY